LVLFGLGLLIFVLDVLEHFVAAKAGYSMHMKTIVLIVRAQRLPNPCRLHIPGIHPQINEPLKLLLVNRIPLQLHGFYIAFWNLLIVHFVKQSFIEEFISEELFVECEKFDVIVVADSLINEGLDVEDEGHEFVILGFHAGLEISE